MTTTARPEQRQPVGSSARVLLVAALCVVVVVMLAAVVAGLVAGSAGALGALVGGSIAWAFFVFGSVVVTVATRAVPASALAIALMTYTLQVALVALVLSVLAGSGAVGTTLAAGWLAAGVIVATVGWTAGQLVASARARIPAYDIELPGPLPAPARAPSTHREVGAP